MNKSLHRLWLIALQERPIYLVLLFYLTLAGSTLNHHDFWGDEVHTYNAVRMDVAELVSTRADAGHPPLFFLLEKLISHLVGVSATALRMLPLLAGAGAVWVTYCLLQLSFSKASSAIGSFVFAIAPAQLLIAQMARSYSLLQLAVLALATIAISTANPSRLILMLMFVLSSLAVYLHSSSLIWLPIIGASLMLIDATHWRAVISILAGSLTYVPFWYLYQHAENVTKQGVFNDEFNVVPFLQLPSRLVLGRLVGEYPIGLSLTVSAIVSCTLIVAFFKSRDNQLAKFFLVQLLLLVWCNIAAAMEGKNMVRTERYFAPLFPITGFVIAAWIDWVAVTSKRTRVILLGAVGSVSLLGVYFYLCSPPFTQDSRIAAYLAEHRREGEPIVLFSNHAARQLSFLYHFQNQQNVHSMLEASPDPLPINTGSLWIVVSPDTEALQKSLLLRDDCRDFRVVSEREFRVSRLLYLERKRFITSCPNGVDSSYSGCSFFVTQFFVRSPIGQKN